MKRTSIAIAVGSMLLLTRTSTILADKPIGFHPKGNQIARRSSGCTTIQSGELYRSDGESMTTGFDKWGYNYQGHMFRGGYCDAYRDAEWCQPSKDVDLLMKWNDAWLANTDCDGDERLDRHEGLDSYIGSGAWITNHQSKTYDLDGKTCNWSYFVKIIAPPAGATSAGGIWYGAGGTEIGPDIWGSFAIIQQVENDPCGGIHSIQYLSPTNAGVGGY